MTLPEIRRHLDGLPLERVTPLLMRHAEAAAKREGLGLATWVRRAVEAAVLRATVRE
jgi:predicted HicB family RNase H-like nuclease